MKILLLISCFDSFLFPRSILFERQFNPAELCKRRFEVVLASEERFELSELRTFSFYSQLDRYSIAIASFGNSSYRENYLELAFGFPVARKFSLGVSAAGLNCWIKDFRNEFAYALKVGGRFESEPFLIGIWVNNVNVPKLTPVDYAPVSYSVRFNYKALGNLYFDFSIRGIEAELPFYNFGLTFMPYKDLLIGLGVNTEPILLEYGLQFSFGKMFMNYSGNRHQQLGLTHNFGLGIVP